MNGAFEDNPDEARNAMCRQLEAEAAQWVGIINAATAQLVDVIGRALDTDAWMGWGIRSPQHWAGLRFGLSSNRAERLVNAVEMLRSLPEVAEAFEAGEISEDLVAAITNAAPTPENGPRVVELAQHTSVAQLRYSLRGIPSTKTKATVEPDPSTGDDDSKPEDEPAPEPIPERPSSASSWFDDDGQWQLRANGNSTDGALIDKALRAAGDRLFRERYGDDADVSLRQRITNFDSFVYLCKVGLDALDPATRSTPGRTPSERYLVNLHFNPNDPGLSEIRLGPMLPKHLRQEATCDALRRLWLEDDCGNVNLGRAARVVDAKLRTVLEHRDGCCRYPGCGRTRGLIAHHLCHWEDGGPTDTGNLVLLCAEHHRAIHRRVYSILGDPNRELLFVGSDGRTLGPLPPEPPKGPVDAAAAAAGLGDATWHNRSGEPGQWDMLTWIEPEKQPWTAPASKAPSAPKSAPEPATSGATAHS